MNEPPRTVRSATFLAWLVAGVAVLLAADYLFLRLPGGVALGLALLHRAQDLAVLLLLLTSAAVAGAELLRRLDVALAPGAYQLTLCLGVGFALPISGVLLLATLQALAPWTILLLLVAPIALFHRRLPELVAGLRAIAEIRLRLAPALLFAAVVATLYLAAALAPPAAPDALTYHLTIPKEYLEHGGVPRDAGNIFRNFPNAFAMLYVVQLALGSDLAPKLLHLLFLAMMLVVALHHFRRHAPAWVAGSAVVLAGCQWTVQHGVTRANVDFQFGFYGLAAFLILAEVVSGEEESRFARGWPWIVGIFLGLAVAGRMQAVSCVLGSAALLLPAVLRRRVRWSSVLLCAAVSLLLYLPTLLRNVVYFFDPFLFYLGDRFGWTFGVDPLELDRFRSLAAMKPIFMTRPSVATFFLTPIFLYTAGAFPTTTFDGFLDPLYLLGLPLGFLFLRRDRFLSALYVYLGGFYLGWFFTAPLTRYALPVLPLLGFLTLASFAHLLAGAAERWRAPLRRGAIALVFALSAFNVLRFAVQDAYLIGVGPAAFLELVSRRDFLARTEAAASWAASEKIAELETRAGRTAPAARQRVFMVFASASYFLRSPYYNDPFYVNLGLLARAGADPILWLRQHGFGYVLFERGRLPWLYGNRHHNALLNPYPEGIALLDRYVAFFRHELEPRLERIETDQGSLVLYRVPEGAPAIARPAGPRASAGGAQRSGSRSGSVASRRTPASLIASSG